MNNNNASKFSKTLTTASRCCLAQTLLQRYVQCLCASINGFDDTSMENSNMVTLGAQKADHHPSQQLLSYLLFNQLYTYYLTPEILQLLANHRWDPIHAAVSILNTYVVLDLNGLDAYTLCTLHEQDSVVARHEKINYTCDVYST